MSCLLGVIELVSPKRIWSYLCAIIFHISVLSLCTQGMCFVTLVKWNPECQLEGR